ncbi:cofactor-independent phosphoglycerate mutase [bacterium]|nr:cofactor-independent phosphoglycerate mutase [bacterium]
MKYLLIVGDGMADYPLEELRGKTPLQAARTPNLDRLSVRGVVGRARTVPSKMEPGSDVANLSLLGYDPRRYHSGRAPLEAASMGVDLKEDEVAFRANLVTVRDGLLLDYSGGHISTQEAKGLIECLNRDLCPLFGKLSLGFYPGVGYRHLLVIKGQDFSSVVCAPPHDITGKTYREYLPEGEGAEILKELMAVSSDLLKDGKTLANMIWLWGQGKGLSLPTFKEKFNLTGSVISAVDLIKGIGKLAGLKVVEVKGATGYLDTNYAGKAKAALGALEEDDFVFVHIEAPDEASHKGDTGLKIRAIEDFDGKVVGPILDGLNGEYRILVLPDHLTPISKKTHTDEPVPFLMTGSGIEPDRIDGFDEIRAGQSSLYFDEGHKLMNYFLKKEQI